MIYIPAGIAAAVVASIVFSLLRPGHPAAQISTATTPVSEEGLPSVLGRAPSYPPGPSRLQPVSSARQIVVASVNGEAITLSDLHRRADLDQVLYTLSSQSTTDFRSEEGRNVFWELQGESLANLVGETLVEQVAKAHEIVLTPDEVAGEIQHILAANGVKNDALASALAQQGLPYADFEAVMTRVARLNKFVDETVLKDVDDAHRDLAARGWFDDLYDEAQIRVYYNLAAPRDELLLSEAQNSAMAYLTANHVEQADAKAVDLGSHVQVDVFVDGRLARELVYTGSGVVKELDWS